MTDEQKALLVHAAQGHVLITVCGSANDLLWGELSDRGWFELADLPEDLAWVSRKLNWHGWKMTDEGIAKLEGGT